MMMTTAERWTLSDELDAVTTRLSAELYSLHGARIFLTGGTGFIGRWLLETFRHAEQRGLCRAEIVILTRDPERFGLIAPHLIAHPSFTFLRGDVLTFVPPEGPFSHIIHGATDASAALNARDPRRMFDTIVSGTRRVLDCAHDKNAQRVLHMSSGAIYGPQPWSITHVDEAYRGGPDCIAPVNAYAEGKRAAEMLCGIYHQQCGLQIAIARIFALLGPFLSLDIHFAAGNFIRDAMNGRTVVVEGHGKPYRSYLYAADLVVFLIGLLVRGPAGRAYNVGSNESVSIAELAQRIATLIGNGQVDIRAGADGGWNLGRYVPSTDAIERELGLKQTVLLDDAIRRTALSNGWTP